MAELKITAANFENEVLHSDKPVLLDFYADWCGPCKMLAPVVHEIAEENAGTLKVGKINVDEQIELAMSASSGAKSCLGRWTMVTAMPISARFSDISRTIKPPPAKTAVFGF